MLPPIVRPDRQKAYRGRHTHRRRARLLVAVSTPVSASSTRDPRLRNLRVFTAQTPELPTPLKVSNVRLRNGISDCRKTGFHPGSKTGCTIKLRGQFYVWGLRFDLADLLAWQFFKQCPCISRVPNETSRKR